MRKISKTRNTKNSRRTQAINDKAKGGQLEIIINFKKDRSGDKYNIFEESQ